MRKPISKDELFANMKTFSKNKSPGNDGLTVEFYEKFWDLISEQLLKSFNESIEMGEMSASQKQSIITLLEKEGKDKLLLKNWRPISLMNFDTKLFSKTLATRLKKTLPTIIHPNQVAYVKDRFIGEGIRLIDSVMDYTREMDVAAFILAIDFEKAFHSVNWAFLWRALGLFGIPMEFIKLVQTLCNNIESCVMNNGNKSGYFKLERSVRQGDPLSPYLFIMIIELLAIKIRNTPEIQGVQIFDQEVKLSIYADDLTGLLSNVRSVKKMLDTLKDFGKASGLKINTDKTEIMQVGKTRPLERTCLNLKWVKEMKITGIWFTYDYQRKMQLNFDKEISKLKCEFQLWRQRNLSLIGKIQIIKTFGLSQILFVLNTVVPSMNVINQICSIMHEFLWNGQDKVKRKIMVKDIENGGLRVPDFKTILDAQRIIWIKRYTCSLTHPWKLFFKWELNKLLCDNTLECALHVKDVENTRLSFFVKEMLLPWSKLMPKPELPEEIGKQVLWFSKYIIRPDGHSLCYKALVRKGLLYVRDMINNGAFMERNDLLNKGYNELEIWYNNSVWNCLPREWRIMGFGMTEYNQKTIRDYSANLTSKNVYRKLVTSDVERPVSEKLFEERYNVDSSKWSDIYALPFQCTIEKRMRSFQFKINHNILFTNEKLFKFGMISSPMSSFCDDEIETLEHLFVNCDYVKPQWNRLKNDIPVMFSNENLHAVSILLGIYNENGSEIVNHIIFFTKNCIFLCRAQKRIPTIEEMYRNMKNTEFLERLIARKRGKIQFHDRKWTNLLDLFEGLM